MTVLHALRSSAAAVIAAVAAFASSPAAAGPYTGMVVFGDSLSDSGNNALVGLYDPGQVVTDNSYVATFSYAPSGTYSNGPVWASYLASRAGVSLSPSLGGGSNYANGGARTGTPGPVFGFPFSLRTQAKQFLNAVGGVSSPEALYVVAGGGNDARAALDQIMSLDLTSALGRSQAKSIIRTAGRAVIKDLSDIVTALVLTGAQDIVVWNLPDLGIVPSIVDEDARAIGSYLTTLWNDAIAATFATVPGVFVFDLFGFGNAAVADPAAFGFVNVTDVCGAAVAGTDCDTYLWWDGVHPTTRAHALIADEMASLVGLDALGPAGASAARFAAAADAVPEPQSMALLALGLAALVAARRRGAVI